VALYLTIPDSLVGDGFNGVTYIAPRGTLCCACDDDTPASILLGNNDEHAGHVHALCVAHYDELRPALAILARAAGGGPR
jgi:hypothetical protein